MRSQIHRLLCHYKQPNIQNVRCVPIHLSQADFIQATHNVYRIRLDHATYYFKQFGEKGKYCSAQEIARIMAYEAIGKLMGLSEIVAESEISLAEVDGKRLLIGILQKESAGIAIWEIDRERRKSMLTAEFQRRINQLRYLDAICHESDHSLNNYYPIAEGDKFTGISAFDNGGMGSFGLSSGFPRTYYGCSALVDGNGRLTFPYIDKALFYRMREVTFSALRRTLCDYMGIIPILQTWRRIQKLIKAVTEKLQTGGVLLDFSDWNDFTIAEEISGKYGNTYLHSLVYEWQDKEPRS